MISLYFSFNFASIRYLLNIDCMSAILVEIKPRIIQRKCGPFCFATHFYFSFPVLSVCNSCQSLPFYHIVVTSFITLLPTVLHNTHDYSMLSCSVSQSCLTLCNPMNRSTPGLPVHHQLLELPKSMSIESVMPSSHLILCRPLHVLPSIFPSIRVFSNDSALGIRWPKYSK